MPKFCSECGAKAEGGKFCSSCGTRFPIETDENTINMSSMSSAIDTMSSWNDQRNSNANSHTNASAPSYQETVAAAQTLAPVVGTAAEKIRQFNNYQQTTKQLPIQVGPNNAMPPRPSYTRVSSSNSNWTPPEKPLPVVTAVEIPSAATGVEAQEVYERCIQTLQAAKGGNNKEGVKEFKKNCKSYGQNQLSAQDFYQTLVLELGQRETVDFIPDLARLIPDEVRRKQLIEYNQVEKEKLTASGAISFSGNRYSRGYSRSKNRESFASSASDETEMSSGDSTIEKKKGKLLTGRYNDHPRCDICQGAFDVSKRRHQCRNCGKFICSSCSPIFMLIPPGQQYENAKGYDPSIPQRVCLHCAPQLEPSQAELVRKYAQSNETNIHEAKGRIHVPFSGSLQKECRNAADIIGNFFRDDWGSAADRSIPVAFLEKAHGIAVMTIIKAGFMITGKIGTGLVVAKLADGSWSAPSAIGTVGMGTGFEIGGEIVEVMIILGSQRAVKVFHTPQINIGAGLDLTVGPYGRSAAAAAAASTSGLNANYTYSQSKGFFAGVSLQGAIIATRNDLNRKFYGRDLRAAEILSGYVEQPTAAKPLYTAIDHALEGVAIHHGEQQRRADVMGACRQCSCPRFVSHTKQVWNKNCKICKHVH